MLFSVQRMGVSAIIYQDITKFMPFYFDTEDQFYFNNTCWMMSSDGESLSFLTAVFNSSIFRSCFKDNFPELLGPSYRLFSVFFEKIPIRKPADDEAALFENLVPMVQRAKRENLDTPAAFLEKLIDACVMELYFPEEAASKKLAYIAPVSALLDRLPALSAAMINDFFTTVNAPGHPIRQSLDRLATASPDIFRVILKEGEV